MAYSEKFAEQWENLKNSFFDDMRKLPAEAVTIERVNDWYKTNSFRWSSIVEKEGVLLDSENNEELKERLLEGIGKFSFKRIDGGKKPRIWPHLAGWAAVSAALGVGIKIGLSGAFWMLAAETAAVLAVSLFLYADRLDRFEKNRREALCRGYERQLEEYKRTLVEICKEFDR